MNTCNWEEPALPLLTLHKRLFEKNRKRRYLLRFRLLQCVVNPGIEPGSPPREGGVLGHYTKSPFFCFALQSYNVFFNFAIHEAKKLHSTIKYLYRKFMALHNDIGKMGEQIAAKYLITKGYIIRNVNWRINRLEIDIVAEKNNRIIIVEVKTRSSEKFGSPLDAITREKISYLVRATKAYLNSYRLSHEVQFDVITIIGNDINNIKIEHIEDAFRAPLRTYR